MMGRLSLYDPAMALIALRPPTCRQRQGGAWLPQLTNSALAARQKLPIAGKATQESWGTHLALIRTPGPASMPME